MFTLNTSCTAAEFPPSVSISFVALRFNIQPIDNTIGKLDMKKAPSIDKITNKMFQRVPKVARRILLLIYNAILRLEYYSAVDTQFREELHQSTVL